MSFDPIETSKARTAPAVILIPVDLVDTLWDEFLPSLKGQYVGAGASLAYSPELAEDMRELAKKGERQLWIVRSPAGVVVTGGITEFSRHETAGPRLSLWPLAATLRGSIDLWRDAGFLALLKKVEAAAIQGGCLNVEIRWSSPTVNQYGYRELPVYTKDLRGPMN